MRAGSTAKSEDLEKLKLESSAALDENNQLVSDLENELSAAKFAEIDKLLKRPRKLWR
jgi:wobble nucleotide-excising tRNase